MKFPFLFLSLLAAFSAVAQPVHPPSPAKDTVSCVSYWKKGDTKIYSIVHEKRFLKPSDKTPPFKFAYEAWITVVDTTDNKYTIKWEFHLPFRTMINRPALADSLFVYNGMKMIFRATATGAFIELLNWEEVRDTYARQLELTLPKKRDSTMTAIIDSANSLFHSKEMVEGSMIQEIQLFHQPYGYQFTSTDKDARTELPNPFGGDPFPALQTNKVKGIDPKKDTFSLAFDICVDKANTSSMMDALFKKMNIKDDQELREGRAKLASFDLHDHSEYCITASTGWLWRLYYERTVSMGDLLQSDSYRITLKN